MLVVFVSKNFLPSNLKCLKKNKIFGWQWVFWQIATKPLALLGVLELVVFFPLVPTNYQWAVGTNSLKYVVKKKLVVYMVQNFTLKAHIEVLKKGLPKQTSKSRFPSCFTGTCSKMYTKRGFVRRTCSSKIRA